MTTQATTHTFEAEVEEILSLVVHSLYSHRDIFLRELISNASDALDRLRFETLTDTSLMESGESLGIALEIDAEARELRVADNGIGMTDEEIVSNLGSIARSGTRRYLEGLKERGAEQAPELIGQFGVGFYSAFMVADRVTVETRKSGESKGWRWVSDGTKGYTLEEAGDLARGTVVTLHMREAGEGEDDLLAEWKLREIVKRYSDFVEYPIQMEVERTGPKLDDDGKPIEGETETQRELETLNSMKPLWSRPRDEIEEQEYHEFYHHLTHDWGEPLETVHFRAEGTLEYTALLYLPKEPPLDLFDPSHNASSTSLYVRRVLIMRDCEELLPPWLRFVAGVVESNDLPLNVSREVLQADRRVQQINKRLTKKILETLERLAGEDRERYEQFWTGFGAVLKEGIVHGEDQDNRISKLCLFQTSRTEGWSTLAEYVERMQEGQEAIHVLSGPSRKALESSPHLEALTADGREVLFLLDPVDEWMLQRLSEFDGHPLRPIDRGEQGLEDEDAREKREERQEESKDLLETLRKALDELVKEVRFTARLKDSAAVLVGEEHGMSAHLERILRRSGQEIPVAKRVLELNPDHALVAGLKRLHTVDAASPRIAEYAELLLGQALIAEGSPLPDPARFSKLLSDLMVDAVSE